MKRSLLICAQLNVTRNGLLSPSLGLDLTGDPLVWALITAHWPLLERLSAGGEVVLVRGGNLLVGEPRMRKKQPARCDKMTTLYQVHCFTKLPCGDPKLGEAAAP